MLIYDINNFELFQNLNSWLIEIEKNAPKKVYKILVINVIWKVKEKLLHIREKISLL